MSLDWARRYQVTGGFHVRSTSSASAPALLENLYIQGFRPETQTMYLCEMREFTRFPDRFPSMVTPGDLHAFQADMCTKGRRRVRNCLRTARDIDGPVEYGNPDLRQDSLVLSRACYPFTVTHLRIKKLSVLWVSEMLSFVAQIRG